MFLKKKKKRPQGVLQLIYDTLGVESKPKSSKNAKKANKSTLIVYIVLFSMVTVLFPNVRGWLQRTGNTVTNLANNKKENKCENGVLVSSFLQKIDFHEFNSDNFLKCINDNGMCRELTVTRASCFNSNKDVNELPQWDCDFEYNIFSNFVPVLDHGTSESGGVECAHAKNYKSIPKGRYGCTPCFLRYRVIPSEKPFLLKEYLSYFFDIDHIFEVLTSLLLLLFYLILSILSCCIISKFSKESYTPSLYQKERKEYKTYYLDRNKKPRRRKKKDIQEKLSSREVNVSNRLYRFMKDYILPNTVVEKDVKGRRRKIEPMELVFDSSSESSQSATDSDFDSDSG